VAPKTDTLDTAALREDLGGAYGVGLIMANKELLALAYRSQGWTDAHVDKQGNLVIGKKSEGEEWDSTKTALEIQNSDWYKNHDGSWRQAENDRLSDPASWQRKVSNITSVLLDKAVKAGAALDQAEAQKYAESMLRNNYAYLGGAVDGDIPDSLVRGYLAPLIHANDKGEYSGQAGITAATLRQAADAYGVKMTDKWYLDSIQKLQAGSITESDLRNQLLNTSRSAWAGLADKISETTTVKDLASSYIQAMADTWEIDPDRIDVYTPEIQKALTFVDPKSGTTRQKTLWEFQQDLRNDPRWDRTAQGRKELGDASMKMLKDFGFVK
jgi:hypothetical protein